MNPANLRTPGALALGVCQLATMQFFAALKCRFDRYRGTLPRPRKESYRVL